MIKKNNSLQNDNIEETTEQGIHQHKLNAHKIGDMSLTITTIILVVVSLYFDSYFAPFIILLMSSRIGKSVYMIVKTNSKKEIGKLVLWLALFVKSFFSYCQVLT